MGKVTIEVKKWSPFHTGRKQYALNRVTEIQFDTKKECQNWCNIWNNENDVDKYIPLPLVKPLDWFEAMKEN